ncbi:MAG: DUF3570 domain-containing protein [Deltaproteobacteria bacterium]|nr:DUF3570 domain-containing protein [Deltaproteobacteria bacterium]
MSGRATLGCLALLLSSCPARKAPPPGTPEFHGEGGLSVYRNDDDLTVISPWVNATQVVSGPVSVTAGWTADVISAATVDLVSQATRPFRDTRKEGHVGVQVDLSEVRAGATYYLSVEHDTISHTASASGDVDLLSRNLTLGLSYGFSAIRFGTAFEPRALWTSRWIHQVDASATQLLGPATLASATYTFQYTNGDLASAYRMVPLFPTSETLWTRPNAQWVYERHPERRFRHAISVTGRHALGDRVFLNAGYRGYLDSWAMRSNAGELGVGFDLGRGFVVEASDRFHWQSSVSFYRSAYTVNREYITADRRLAKLMTNIAALSLRPRTEQTEWLIRGELHWTRYPDHQILLGDDLVDTPDVWGFVGQVGFGLDVP